LHKRRPELKGFVTLVQEFSAPLLPSLSRQRGALSKYKERGNTFLYVLQEKAVGERFSLILSRALKKGPMETLQLLRRVYRQVLDILQPLEAEIGFRHCDLHTNNLYIAYAGTLREQITIIDFDRSHTTKSSSHCSDSRNGDMPFLLSSTLQQLNKSNVAEWLNGTLTWNDAQLAFFERFIRMVIAVHRTGSNNGDYQMRQDLTKRSSTFWMDLTMGRFENDPFMRAMRRRYYAIPEERQRLWEHFIRLLYLRKNGGVQKPGTFLTAQQTRRLIPDFLNDDI
jgi:hypothetical protein